MRRLVAAAVVAAVTVGTAVLAAQTADPGSSSQPAQAIVRARFNLDGSVDLPVGYRQWEHVGTRYKPDGISILDGLPLNAPEIFNAYVEPSAIAAFRKTGRWPDGTQIVKEMSAIEVGPGCDATTRICSKAVGTGIFEAHFNGLGMMVKDAARFPDAPGNWGYFSFGHKPQPYDGTSPVRAKAQCEQCHAGLAADTDYVIIRAHIGLWPNDRN